MRLTIFCLIIAQLITSCLLAFEFHLQHEQRTSSRVATCTAFGKSNATINGIIQAGEKTLPTTAYYKANPDELVTAIQFDDHARTVIAANVPSYCGPVRKTPVKIAPASKNSVKSAPTGKTKP